MSFILDMQFRDHVRLVMGATASLNPGAVAANSTATATITVPGALVGDEASVVCATPLGNVLLNAEVTAPNTVTIKFANTSAGAVTPAGGAANYTALVWRLDPVCFT